MALPDIRKSWGARAGAALLAASLLTAPAAYAGGNPEDQTQILTAPQVQARLDGSTRPRHNPKRAPSLTETQIAVAVPTKSANDVAPNAPPALNVQRPESETSNPLASSLSKALDDLTEDQLVALNDPLGGAHNKLGLWVQESNGEPRAVALILTGSESPVTPAEIKAAALNGMSRHNLVSDAAVVEIPGYVIQDPMKDILVLFIHRDHDREVLEAPVLARRPDLDFNNGLRIKTTKAFTLVDAMAYMPHMADQVHRAYDADKEKAPAIGAGDVSQLSSEAIVLAGREPG
ncbi:MAG: hypothetical protein ACPGRX_00805 [Bdellovibrionales bacterium]